MHPNASRLDLFSELQALDRVPRMGYLLRGVANPESVAEHAFHVAFLVWALASEVPGLDSSRAVELALLHDIGEARLGDLPRTAGQYLPPGAKHDGERAAFAELTAPLGARSTALFDEYLAGTSAEARFVRACDKLQLMIKVAVYERQGSSGLGEFWGNSENFPTPGEFDVLDGVVAQLRARRR